MNIYSCIDNKNIDKIIVLFYSCYINCSQKDKLKFYLLVESEFDYQNVNIPDVLKDILFVKGLDYYELEKSGWINIINDFNKYFYIQGSKCKHIMNFARFFIFKFFPEIERAIYLLLATRVELSRSSPCLRKPVVLWLQTLYSNCSPLSIRPCSVLWIFMVAFCISLFVVRQSESRH